MNFLQSIIGLLFFVPVAVVAQNVGIGTSTPISPLTVIAPSGKGIIQKSGDVEIGFYTSGTAAYIQTWSNHNLLFGTNNKSAAMTLTTENELGIGIAAPENKLHVVGAAATANNATIFAQNIGNVGSAVYGLSNSAGTIGVTGLAGSGTGVYGYSNNYRGVTGSSISGTALYGNSLSGYGLEVSGKVKISGGNTNPENGAVLASDAVGNAVWKPQRVAFKAFGVNPDHDLIPDQSARRVQFGGEFFDTNGDYALLATNTTPTSNSSVFTAPVSGVYHFDVVLALVQQTTGLQDIESADLKLIRQRNGVETVLAVDEAKRKFRMLSGTEMPDGASFYISVTESLLAGDRLYVNIYQSSGIEARISPVFGGRDTYFCGHLVFAD